MNRRCGTTTREPDWSESVVRCIRRAGGTGSAMNAKNLVKVTSAVAVAFFLALTLSQSLDAQSETSAPGANPTDAASRSASELQSLVAPIALYPDSLVAQVLTGATFPDQIAVAD